MKKRNVGKYEPSYKAKRDEELKERQFKRELGIKAGYKKLLRQQNFGINHPSNASSLNSSTDGNVRKTLEEAGERTLYTSGWNVTAIPTDLKPVKYVPKGWSVAEENSAEPKLLKKPKDWIISAEQVRKNESVQKPEENWNNAKRDTAGLPPKTWDSKSGEGSRNFKGPGGLGGKPSALKKAHNVFARKQQERAERASMYEKRQKERDVALKNRKEKRLEKFKILNQKTPKGQPVMKGRMQLLLQKIQSSL